MATLDLPFQRKTLPGPAPELGADAVHIWRVDLSGPMAARGNVLSPEEQSRAARIKHEGARSTFHRARTVLRLILGAYTGLDPAHLPIVIDGRGKPALDLPGAPFFNLSHTGALALVAVTRAAPVGVDIEIIRPAPRLDDLAARFFASGETAALRALPDAQRLDAFYACWTRKEAFVKAEGSGIANALSDFEVSVHPDEPARILSIKSDAASAGARTLHAFRPAPGAWGAVCLDAAPIEAIGFELVATDIKASCA
jgi:4'-phosphopantetheinyl transferase